MLEITFHFDGDGQKAVQARKITSCFNLLKSKIQFQHGIFWVRLDAGQAVCKLKIQLEQSMAKSPMPRQCALESKTSNVLKEV
jgi:hypothetical protein